MQPVTSIQEDKLPSLRQDISITTGGASWTGAPTWVLHDKFRNRFFRIDLLAFEMLARWKPISPTKLAANFSKELGLEVSKETVLELAEFLFKNALTERPADTTQNEWASYYQQALAQQKTILNKIIHSYLFFKIPLTRPQRFIDFCWPYVAPFFTKTAVMIFTLLAVLGMYLVSRQWQNFTNTFLDFLSPQGFFIYAVSLVFIKIIHEMGHAFMAKKYDASVSVIGIAFVVLMPILYTDTTDATRLSSRRKRLMIDLAGISAELALASICTLLWVFLPDGPLRSVAFTTATLSWVLSIGVNLNPFMRFDGYYILSDIMGLENLQERGFVLARWRMREFLFGLKKTAPEVLPKSWRTLVILHAWGTWVYRFFLFLGIALLVYTFFIKLIGILLFIIEISWFILMPIGREVKTWWQLKSEILVSKHSILNSAVIFVLLALFFLPWSTKIEVPSVLHYSSAISIYAPKSGNVTSHNFIAGKTVSKGDVLAILNSPDLESKIILTEKKILLLKARMARSSADATERSLLLILEQELSGAVKQQEGLLNQRDALVLRAPISGTLENVDPDFEKGIWLNSSTRLAIIKPNEIPAIIGLVAGGDLSFLQQGNTGKFIPDNLEFKSRLVKVKKLSAIATVSLDESYLADVFGGKISVLPTADKGQAGSGMKLRGAWFPVEMNLDITEHEMERLEYVISGVAVINGKHKSIAGSFLKRVASVLIREFGF